MSAMLLTGGSPRLRAGSTASVEPVHVNVILATSDGGEIKVDKEELCASSKFFSDMLTTCDAERISVNETKDDMQMVVDAIHSQEPAGTFDTTNSVCWDVFKRLLSIADKYDLQVVRERSEKWLVSRCLRGKTRTATYKFQSMPMAMEWLLLCQTYNLRDLGWFVAWDMGLQLASGLWPREAAAFMQDLTDPQFLKIILEAVAEQQRSVLGDQSLVQPPVVV